VPAVVTRPCAFGFAFFALSSAASAQQTTPRPVRWSLSVPVANVAELRARIVPGWHLYSLTQPPGGPRPTLIEIIGESPFRLAGPIGRAAPDTIPDAVFGIMSEVYDDSVTFHLPLAIRSPPLRGDSRLAVAVTFQACMRRLCLRPRTDTVDVAVRSRR